MKYVCPLITVEDIAVSKDFYVKLLKQKVKYDFGESVTFEGDFAIHSRSHFSALIGGISVSKAGNGFELYFEQDDMDAFAEVLKKNHVELVHDVREQPWRQKVVRFYDPDKNIIEVGESLEFLAYRLSREGKTVREISAVINMPESFAAAAIERNVKGSVNMSVMKYHHIGIPTKTPMEGEVYLKDFKAYHCGYERSEFGIEWMRYEEGCPLPELVKTVPHIAFEVDDVHEAIKGRKVLIEPNSPSGENVVAFIEENGAPIEFIQLKKR